MSSINSPSRQDLTTQQKHPGLGSAHSWSCLVCSRHFSSPVGRKKFRVKGMWQCAECAQKGGK